MKPVPLCLFVAVGFACASSLLWAQAPASRSEVWMGPSCYDNGKCFRELFEKPDEWKETRALIDELLYTDLNLKRQFTHEELQAWLPRLKEWNIKPNGLTKPRVGPQATSHAFAASPPALIPPSGSTADLVRHRSGNHLSAARCRRTQRGCVVFPDQHHRHEHERALLRSPHECAATFLPCHDHGEVTSNGRPIEIGPAAASRVCVGLGLV